MEYGHETTNRPTYIEKNMHIKEMHTQRYGVISTYNDCDQEINRILRAIFLEIPLKNIENHSISFVNLAH